MRQLRLQAPVTSTCSRRGRAGLSGYGVVTARADGMGTTGGSETAAVCRPAERVAQMQDTDAKEARMAPDAKDGREELPGTLKRSPKKAQRTWIEAHDSAVESYGEGERAHRTAFAAVKHSFEKVGDH